ncbi:hypothetical protein GCM10012275_27470 [Longimycelium tulufanense]|uniref:Uncharacterized protein n=1 Tax=Longimycelium tulufanense TaxID=907463 RepID=A0A8J3C8J8_9PSEU|nr:hypothetical protein [Longimycelium tulufanense]GGM54873.1 hypothetical protein GCM10012275_27470 [Longimycelium tulufanense]
MRPWTKRTLQAAMLAAGVAAIAVPQASAAPHAHTPQPGSNPVTNAEELKLLLPMDTCNPPGGQTPGHKRVPCIASDAHLEAPNPSVAADPVSETVNDSLTDAGSQMEHDLQAAPQAPAATISGTGENVKNTGHGVGNELKEERPLTDTHGLEKLLDAIGTNTGVQDRAAPEPARPAAGFNTAVDNVGMLKEPAKVADVEVGPYNPQRPQALGVGDQGVTAEALHGQHVQPFDNPIGSGVLDLGVVDDLAPAKELPANQALPADLHEVGLPTEELGHVVMPVSKGPVVDQFDPEALPATPPGAEALSVNPLGNALTGGAEAVSGADTLGAGSLGNDPLGLNQLTAGDPLGLVPRSAEPEPRAGKVAPGTGALTKNAALKPVTGLLGGNPLGGGNPLSSLNSLNPQPQRPTGAVPVAQQEPAAESASPAPAPTDSLPAVKTMQGNNTGDVLKDVSGALNGKR